MMHRLAFAAAVLLCTANTAFGQSAIARGADITVGPVFLSSRLQPPAFARTTVDRPGPSVAQASPTIDTRTLAKAMSEQAVALTPSVGQGRQQPGPWPPPPSNTTSGGAMEACAVIGGLLGFLGGGMKGAAIGGSLGFVVGIFVDLS